MVILMVYRDEEWDLDAMPDLEEEGKDVDVGICIVPQGCPDGGRVALIK